MTETTFANWSVGAPVRVTPLIAGVTRQALINTDGVYVGLQDVLMQYLQAITPCLGTEAAIGLHGNTVLWL